jgi:dephospho-CoA kinase
MLRVGLTGNIASGKSSVAEVWRGLGATVVDADELARRAVEPGSPALQRIVEEWGTGVIHLDGTLNRGALRAIVFRDAEARRLLETIVHPAVALLRQRAFVSAHTRGEPLVVADVPLLFEAGLDRQFDLVVLVDAPEDLRLQRLVENRGLAPEEAKRMIQAQMPAAEKRARADIAIENAGTKAELESEARAAFEEIRRRADLLE